MFDGAIPLIGTRNSPLSLSLSESVFCPLTPESPFTVSDFCCFVLSELSPASDAASDFGLDVDSAPLVSPVVGSLLALILAASALLTG
jgi:hypothetical protein